jgi:D-serine deaminase-like pyridoxal phosphate-dependent protein
MRIDELETPALLLDLDAMESNLATVSDFFRQSAVKARPHFKNHAVVALAQHQISAGAMGITVARVRHAEALVASGVGNILVASEIVDDDSLQRLIEISRRAEVILCVDNEENIARIARLAGDAKPNINLVIYLEVGLGRCGAPPKEALRLARMARDAGLRVRGLMGYEGHLQKLAPTEQTQSLRNEVAEILSHARLLLEEDGFRVDIVTLGGTGTYKTYASCPGITEVQVGSYLVMDTLYKPFAPDFRLALTVLTRVVSCSTEDHIVLDAGLKAISGERGLPEVKGVSGLRVAALHAEHAIVAIENTSLRVRNNDLLELWVQYSDATIHLHRVMYGVRNGEVEEVFPIEY